MKRSIAVLMMVSMVCGISYAEGPAYSVSMDAASAYVFRGTTFNDGLVLQPGGEAAMGDITVGVWGNYDVDDYGGTIDDNKLSEVDYYASYALPVDAVGLSVGYTAYNYPDSDADTDHEISMSAEIDAMLSPSLAVYYGVDGGIKKSVYVELGLGHEFEISEDLTAETTVAVGYLDPDSGDSGFSHANIGVDLGYKIFHAGVTYVAQLDDKVLPDVADGGGYDSKVYGTVGVGYEF